MKEVNDVREYEDEDRTNAAAGLLAGSRAENNDDDAGHHIAAQRWVASNGACLSVFLFVFVFFEEPKKKK